MAGKVGVKENEYTDWSSGIKTGHQEILTQIEAVLAKMESLNSQEGGFYTRDLNKKVDNVISEIRDLSSGIGEVFSAHEEIVESFQQSIDDYDTCC